MEHKLEQILNKTSATDPGALVLILSDLVSFLAPNHSKENSLSAQQIRIPKRANIFIVNVIISTFCGWCEVRLRGLRA